jgi:hypothetical protein
VPTLTTADVVPAVVGAAGFQFAVLSGGVTMPLVQVAATQQAQQEQPIANLTPATAPALSAEIAPNYVPPVYPRKQARN